MSSRRAPACRCCAGEGITKRGQDICVQSRMAYSRVFVVDSNGGHGTILCALKVCKDVFVQCGTTLYYSSRCKYDISPC